MSRGFYPRAFGYGGRNGAMSYSRLPTPGVSFLSGELGAQRTTRNSSLSGEYGFQVQDLTNLTVLPCHLVKIRGCTHTLISKQSSHCEASQEAPSKARGCTVSITQHLLPLINVFICARNAVKLTQMRCLGLPPLGGRSLWWGN